MDVKIERMRVAGFRSLRDVKVEFGDLTILIGPNGAGKSNLLSALEMIRLLAFESLQLFVSERGGASFLMHYGPKVTSAIDIDLEFRTESGFGAYQARLGYGADESLIFLVEQAGVRQHPGRDWQWHSMGAGHRESRLRAESDNNATARMVRRLLRGLNFYHFHDTSRNSALRTRAFADTSDSYLRSDGSNLPAYLRALREGNSGEVAAAWKRITGLLQQIAPFIRELTPLPAGRGVSLDWVDDKGESLGPSHLSDGTLRALALLTALGQPSERLPLLSCIDEPELGLHPAALALVGDLVSSVTSHHQVLLSTQSSALLDRFEPEDIVVCERQAGETVFSRLPSSELEAWLEDYSLSQLYEKNLLGGRP